MDEQRLHEIVSRVLAELDDQSPTPAPAPEQAPEEGPATRSGNVPSGVLDIEEAGIPDIQAVDYRRTLLVDDPANPEDFLRYKARTWARIGLGRSGPRYRTGAQLRFWADNASAMDAVASDVSQEMLDRLGLFTVQTQCASKDEYLAKPYLGARFDEAAIAEIVSRCTAGPAVQIIVADGLSSTAVEANAPELLPALEQGLRLNELAMGTPFYVKYGRVRAMDTISEALGATVTCILLGERPGLATAESLSAYIAYKARVGMPEAQRTCVSNIHDGGTNAAEAGAHIADVIAEMIRQKASGINLRV